MKYKQAIAYANELRPNAISDEPKSRWLSQIEGQLAEMYGVEPPKEDWPVEDRELLLPEEHCETYVKYLCAQIDKEQQDMDLYANDMVDFNAAYRDAIAFYRRHHRPDSCGNWKVM